MQSVSESKQELEASIRYAENAISSAKATIESMEFRQEMAKKQYAEQTGREEALTKQVQELEERNDELNIQIVEQTNREATLEREVAELRDIIDRMGDDITGDSVTIKQLQDEVQRQKDIGQGYYDSMMTFKQEVANLKECLKIETAALERIREDVPTMPVIPKDVAIAIFREGMQHGVESACTELDNAADISIEENEYCGGFEVSFSKYIDLSDHLDTDWMRGKCGECSEEFVVDALSTLCSDKEFECRIHGVDDEEILRRDWKKEDDEAKDSASA